MLSQVLRRSTRRVIPSLTTKHLVVRRTQSIRFATSWKNEGKADDNIQFKWFLLVGVFGTLVYMAVMQRIQEQDHMKNVERYKKTFTEAEWNEYITQIQQKHLTLESGEECYLVPYTNKNDTKAVNTLVEKLGGSENVHVVDLNELVSNQIGDALGKAKYHILLSQTLEKEDTSASGFKYSFSYKLKPGIFTQMVNDEITSLQKAAPTKGRVLVLNYPPNIKEAIKFEQNICNRDTLVVLDDKSNETDIVQYFETVDKVKSLKAMPKLEPLVVDTVALEQEHAAEEIKEEPVFLKTLPAGEPSPDAPAIQKAQYKLRQFKEPIRYYGETDEDIINRLKSLQK